YFGLNLDAVWAARDADSSSQLRDALERCIGKLSDKAKRIIRLRYGEGLNGEQVAAAMAIRVRSVYQALSRIHVALADCIRQQMSVKD
ncbi:MAG: sigma-70 family RNA polymerase sigma factor, partial [Planctomycetaceae bacterium]|nr:sigma-70 family RNA polymerase sigma factor [Planctomycetaceae bacterium]